MIAALLLALLTIALGATVVLLAAAALGLPERVGRPWRKRP